MSKTNHSSTRGTGKSLQPQVHLPVQPITGHYSGSPSYFNTTHEDGHKLAELIGKASKQAEIVLILFKAFGSLTPSQCLSEFCVFVEPLSIPPPLTSIRRAITTLTKRGYLIKTEIKKVGIYGAKEYVWQIK